MPSHYLPINRPGLRCFNDTGDCAVPCEWKRGFIGPCDRPHFFSLVGVDGQPSNWQVLETGTGMALKFKGGLITVESWNSQFYPNAPSAQYFATPIEEGPDVYRAKHVLTFYQLCAGELPSDPPIIKFWRGETTTQNTITQSQVVFTPADMGTSPPCSTAWPKPPFRVFPQGCCNGQMVVIEEDPA